LNVLYAVNAARVALDHAVDAFACAVVTHKPG
jgi:hypothetical protein